jgi:hypothetical protein
MAAITEQERIEQALALSASMISTTASTDASSSSNLYTCSTTSTTSASTIQNYVNTERDYDYDDMPNDMCATSITEALKYVHKSSIAVAKWVEINSTQVELDTERYDQMNLYHTINGTEPWGEYIESSTNIASTITTEAITEVIVDGMVVKGEEHKSTINVPKVHWLVHDPIVPRSMRHLWSQWIEQQLKGGIKDEQIALREMLKIMLEAEHVARQLAMGKKVICLGK